MNRFKAKGIVWYDSVHTDRSGFKRFQLRTGGLSIEVCCVYTSDFAEGDHIKVRGFLSQSSTMTGDPQAKKIVLIADKVKTYAPKIRYVEGEEDEH